MQNTKDFPGETQILDGLVVFISGVPGAGKTTISYELLNRYDIFRIIQETDLIREILRGYNKYVQPAKGMSSIKIQKSPNSSGRNTYKTQHPA